MEVKEFIENNERNYKEEKQVLEEFYNIFKKYIDKKSIDAILDQNGFNGIYLLDNELYNELTFNENTAGAYNSPNGVIFLNETIYSKHPLVAVHELGHAYLDCLRRSIGAGMLTLGRGLEEGLLTVLMASRDIDNPVMSEKLSYPIQSRTFLQLNELYKKSLKQYKNLLIHIFKEPTLYDDMVEQIYLTIFELLGAHEIVRSAYRVLSGLDAISLKKLTSDNKDIYTNIVLGIEYINLIYLSIADSNARKDEYKNPLFLDSDVFKDNCELSTYSYELNMKKNLKDISKIYDESVRQYIKI